MQTKNEKGGSTGNKINQEIRKRNNERIKKKCKEEKGREDWQ
jgi:hypothetical protein